MGRSFFGCRSRTCGFFAWVDPATGSIDVQPPIVSGPPGPPCWCGQPTKRLVAKKEGPNQGRTFFGCEMPRESQCGYFQWDGDEAPQIPQGPPCLCQVPSKISVTQKPGPNMGRPFFSCPRRTCDFFAWVDPGTGSIDVQPPMASGPPGPPCFCGQPTKRNVAKKEGPNQGRTFFCCDKLNGNDCGYFQWDGDEVPKQGPPCLCQVPSRICLTQKPGPNMGRSFFGCRSRTCGFFAWVDPATGSIDVQPPIVSGPPGPPCWCGQPTKRLVAKKEGPNQGRTFFGCEMPRESQCGYFQWDGDEAPQAPRGSPNQPPIATPLRNWAGKSNVRQPRFGNGDAFGNTSVHAPRFQNVEENNWGNIQQSNSGFNQPGADFHGHSSSHHNRQYAGGCGGGFGGMQFSPY